jgi:hypothetical protein
MRPPQKGARSSRVGGVSYLANGSAHGLLRSDNATEGPTDPA